MNEDYDSWIETNDDFNSYSALYCLEPMAIKTAYVESLTSYISRLAKAHCVKAGSFLSRIIFPMLNKRYLNNGGRGFFTSSHLINGVTGIASEFIDVLEQLSERGELAALTLLRFSNILPTRGLLKNRKSWCPLCLQEMRNHQQIVSEPLLWMLQSISVCTAHNVKLQETCPVCHKSSLVLETNSNPGYCSKCCSWLGLDIFDHQQDLNSEWEAFKANSIIKFLSSELKQLAKENVAWTLRTLVHRFSRDNAAAFAKFIEVPKSTFWGWETGKNLPTLDDVLRICNKCEISLEQFYLGERRESVLEIVIPAKRIKKKNVVVTQKTVSEIGNAFKTLILDRSNMRFNVTHIAKRLQCNKKTLYNYHGPLCKLQTRVNNYYRSNRKALRIMKLNGEISKACREIYDSGQFPSVQKLENKLKRPAVLREKETGGFYRTCIETYLKSDKRGVNRINIR